MASYQEWLVKVTQNTGEIAIVTNVVSSFSLCTGLERFEKHLMLYKTAE